MLFFYTRRGNEMTKADYDKMIAKRKDFISPSPGSVHNVGGMKGAKIKPLKADDKPADDSIRAVPVFKVGNWKGKDYTQADLDEMAKNTNALIRSDIHTPPLKLGHNESQEILKNDGLPNAGHGTNFYRVGDTLYADFTNLPEMVMDLIKAKRYTKVSIELYDDFKYPGSGENIGKVIRAIAILGEDVPAVKGLADIHKMFYSEGSLALITFSETDFKEDTIMDWTKEEIKERVPCCFKEAIKFMEDNKLDRLSSKQLAEVIQLKKYDDAPVCPEGFKWNGSLCEPIGNAGTAVGSNPADVRKVCPPGMKYNEDSKKCEKVEIKKNGDPKPEDVRLGDQTADPEDADLDTELCDEMFKTTKDKISPDQKKAVDQMKERVKKVIAKHKTAPVVKASDEEIDPAEKEKVKAIAKKSPKDWTPEEHDLLKKHGKPTLQASYAEFKAKKKDKPAEGQGQPGAMTDPAEKPSDEWMASCLAEIGKDYADDETKAITTCYSMFAHKWGKGEAIPDKKEVKPAEKTPEQILSDKKFSELDGEVKKLRKEKYDAKIKELKENNKGIFLPKFDPLITAFSEGLEDSKLVKFDDADVSIKDLFFQFLSELAQQKMVIFAELTSEKKLKADNKLIEVDDAEAQKDAEKFKEEGKPDLEVSNSELSLMAMKIQKRDSISYRDALVKASHILSGK